MGDVHGHLQLALCLLARWQRHWGRPFSAVRLCGDVGTFTCDSQLDLATVRHARDNPCELEFLRQWSAEPPAPWLARNWGAAACARRMFLEEVFRFQRRKARRAGAVKPKTGAISFTQRFGSKLNAHLHHHAVLPDGAFSTLDDGALCFVRIAAPTLEDLERILARVIRRTTRMLVSRGLLEEPDPEDALAHLQAESLQAGLPWRSENQRSSSRLAVQLDGYSLEAGACVHEHDRLGLLHLCRYGLRAPFSQ